LFELTSCRRDALGQLRGEPPLPRHEAPVLERDADVRADRRQRCALSDRNLPLSLDRQHPDGPTARHQRRREGTARPPTAAGILDEYWFAASENSRHQRALRHPKSTGDNEPIVVAA